MVYRTAVRADGTIPLGEAAMRLGFAPGTPVDVIVTRAGSLILRIDDSPALDGVTYAKAVAIGAAQRDALRDGWAS